MPEIQKGRPDDDYVKETCRPGAGEDTCRYLLMDPKGWLCGKYGEFRAHIDQRVLEETMVARGNNCVGFLE